MMDAKKVALNQRPYNNFRWRLIYERGFDDHKWCEVCGTNENLVDVDTKKLGRHCFCEPHYTRFRELKELRSGCEIPDDTDFTSEDQRRKAAFDRMVQKYEIDSEILSDIYDEMDVKYSPIPNREIYEFLKETWGFDKSMPRIADFEDI
jgi:hypothetical protein